MAFIFYLLQVLYPDFDNRISEQSPVLFYEKAYERKLHRENEIVCLSRIIYNESRGEPTKGKILVAQTTLNRVNSGKFQDSVCESMKAKGAYSFYNPRSKKVDKKRKYPVEYKHIAEKALNGEYSHLLSDRVLYFKNCGVQNSFFNRLVMVKRVGAHCFFAEPKHLIAEI